MVWEKSWTTHLFRELQAALPGLRAVRLIPAGSAVDSLLGIMATHTVGKAKPGLCAIRPTTGLVYCRMRTDMIAINNYFPAGEPQAYHSKSSFEWQAVQAQWWDDLSILSSHPTVPPLNHIPDSTLPTLHRMKGLSSYWGIADPPPPSLRPSPPGAGHPCRTPPRMAPPTPPFWPTTQPPRWFVTLWTAWATSFTAIFLSRRTARPPRGGW